MSGNSFGKLFRITSFGESHGPAIGVVIDGCPAGLSLDTQLIQRELDRRRPGQSKISTPRKEADTFELLSGVFEGRSTGAPISAIVRNLDVKSKDYDNLKQTFRPGHADFTYFAKYGHRDYRGGGRSSARETIGRVIGGAIAKQLLSFSGVEIRGAVVQIGKIVAKRHDWQQVEENEVRGLDPDLVGAMREEIKSAQQAHDSVGGIVEVQALGVCPGLGEPVFDRLDAQLASAMMSLPAVKGVEIGAGFQAATMRGSAHNDQMLEDGFASNNHGGILGGITSGAPIVVRLALKPTSSISQELCTLNEDMQQTTVITTGRHDPCVAIRAVPIAESMLALVLVDNYLQFLGARTMQQGFYRPPQVAYSLSGKNGPAK